MPYTIQPVMLCSGALDPGLGQASAGYHGWPTVSFRYFLLSHWVCLGTSARALGSGPGLTLYSVGSNLTSVTVGLLCGETAPMFNGTFAADLSGEFQHIMVSADAGTHTIQVYVNDAPLVQTGDVGWTPNFSFNIDPAVNNFGIGGSGAAGGPGLADFYCTAPASFFDLSVTANRRKFINADLSPVDLGTNASSVMGTPPIDYLTVRPGGVPGDFATNFGTGGAFTVAGAPLTFLAAGSCPMPTRPVVASLAMDNVVAIDQSPAKIVSNQIFLDWSDDRGHSYGSPVGQHIGATGAYLTSIQWQRIGYARDRVFRLTWSVPVATALQGAFIEVEKAKS